MVTSVERNGPAQPTQTELTVNLHAHVIAHLDDALDNGWIRAFYQPVIRTVTGKVCGMEALARWDDPVYGLLPPSVFISALEDARTIHKLDIYMIKQVCRQLRDSLDAGLPTIPMSFNLSRLDFDLCDMHAIIEQEVLSHEIPRFLINVEITESVFGAEPAFMATAIDKFHSIGYQVWMDDFGSAYSSLNVLKDFDFDEVKIDMEFLSRFGERSRAIIASMVDMSKRLGIQTLAEGVETREHSEFLHHIGCEKQQGYFYGRPAPYSIELIELLDKRFGIEEQSERHYYSTIGSVNTLSLSESDFMPENTTKDYVTSMPLAFVEYDGLNFTVLDFNEPFVRALESIGIDGVEQAQDFINDISRQPARSARRLIETLEEKRFARHDYVSAGIDCVMRARFVASYQGRTTALVTLKSAESMREDVRRSEMDRALESLYSIYEHVDIIHLDEGYSEPLYSQAAFKEVYDVPDLSEAIRQFAHNEVYPGDRDRYLEFMNMDTLVERIDAGKQGYIVGFFRVRDRGGDYVWKLFALIRLTERDGNLVMICIRDTNWSNDELFEAAYEGDGEEVAFASGHEITGLGMTDGSLWRAISQDPQFGMFWKDTQRRFVGCNQAFLDYYGFESADAVLGKTDEDVGWHVNPVPFMKDERAVLEKGIAIDRARGQCIARGELRDIVATKLPVYRNGKIVGLVGYFIDAVENDLPDSVFGQIPYTDAVTGLLNYSGLDAVTGRYIEAFQKNDTDFAMIMLDIENFKAFNDQYGYDFGDKVLKRVADILGDITRPDCVVGHIYADRFVILRQKTDERDMRRIAANVVDALSAITNVGETRCTIFARFSIVLFSEASTLEEFKSLGRERLHEAKRQTR